MDRIIFHIDVNSAFLSWSAVKLLKENPAAQDLRLIPSAVGGDMATRHGIITAKSIPAKKFGVTTGEPVAKALEKCPQLVLVPSDFETYRAYSRAFINILHSYTDKVQQVSIDEAYVDVTEVLARRREHERQNAGKLEGAQGFHFSSETGADPAGGTEAPSAEPEYKAYLADMLALAEEIRTRVKTELSFTVNVGISSNKLLAKMASDFEKPDKTHTLFPEEIPDKLWVLPIRDLYGCGGKTAARLMTMGIRTIGDAAHTEVDILTAALGDKAGQYIHRAANGISESPVHTEREKAKSYSNETTTSEDITAANYAEKAPAIVRQLSEHVSRRMVRDNMRGETVQVSVKTNDFRRRSRQMKLLSPTNEADRIEEAALTLLGELLFGRGGTTLERTTFHETEDLSLLPEENGLFGQGAGVRLIGVGMTSLTDSPVEQMDLFSFFKSGGDGAADKGGASVSDGKTTSEGDRKSGVRTLAAPGSKKKEEPARDKIEVGKETGAKKEVIGKKMPARKKAAEKTQKKPPAKEAAPEAKSASDDRERRLEEMMQKVKQKFGEGALVRGK